jgi:hypothetical protein
MKTHLFCLLLGWGIVTVICLGLYSPKEMDVNITTFNDGNSTRTESTGKLLVAQNAMVACSTFITASLMVYYEMYDKRTEKRWQNIMTFNWLLIDVMLVVGTYPFCCMILSNMCHQNMCFKSYTPLYWLMWFDFILLTFVASIMVIITILAPFDACIEGCCPGLKRLYKPYCISFRDKFTFCCTGIRLWELPIRVKVERGQMQELLIAH